MARSSFETLHLAIQGIRKVIGTEHVTLPQATVLRAIRDADEVPSQTDLVNATGIDRSTLASVVDRLLKEGLISRERDKRDARAYQVSLTESGRGRLKAFENAEKRATPEISRVLKDLRIKIG